MALVLRARLHTFPIEFADFYVGLVHVDGGPRAVALVLHWLPLQRFPSARGALVRHWLALQRLPSLWCFTGYHFSDSRRLEALWCVTG